MIELSPETEDGTGPILFLPSHHPGRHHSCPSRSTKKSGLRYCEQRQIRSISEPTTSSSPPSNSHGRAGHALRSPHVICDMSATLRHPCPTPQGAGAEQTHPAAEPGDPPGIATSFLQPVSGHRSARPEGTQFCGDQGSRPGGPGSRDRGRVCVTD